MLAPSVRHYRAGTTKHTAALRAPLAGVGLLAAAACHSYLPTTAPLPQNAALRIRYSPAQAVPVLTAGRNSPRWITVRELRGRLISNSGDTLRLRLFGAVHANEDAVWRLPRGATVLAIRRPGATVDARRLSVAKTAGAAVATAAVAVGIGYAILYIGLSSAGPGY